MGAISTTSTKYGTSVAVDITNDTITPGNDVKIVTLKGTTGAWTFETDAGNLYWGSGNSLNVKVDQEYTWAISIGENGEAEITSVTATPKRILRYNSSSPRFACYESGQTAIQLYKKSVAPAGHTHSYTSEITTQVTCTQAGVETFTCANTDGLCNLVSYTQSIPATGHTYVDGVCSVCHEKQPTTLTINRDSFGDVSGYAWHSWTATASTGETISGSGFIYGTTKASMQMNGSKAGDYIYNTTALPGTITSVTLTKASENDRNFDVLTSDTPFDSVTTASLKGQETDAKKLVTTDGVTWEFTTSRKYFAIVICDSAAAYLSSIEIEYYVCPHTNKVAIGEAKDATCTEDGITAGEKCADCGEITTPQETISATGHKDENADSKCDVCGANCCKEHSAGEWEEKTAASCTAAGERVKKCENCGEEMETEEISALGHALQEEIITPATCTTAGKKAQVCQRENCEYKEGETEIPATGHTWVNGTCQNCGATQGVYVKVTEAPADWSGSYLIVYEAENIAFNGSLVALDVAGNGETVTISNNVIIADNAINFTVAAVDGGYSIQSASGLYIGKTASGNGMNTNERTSYVNTFSVNSNGSIDIISSGGSILKYNNTSGQDRFRYYGSGQQEIALYKLVDEVDDFKKLTTEASFKLTYQKDNNQYVKDENGHYVIETVKLRFGMTLDKDLSEKLLALGGTFNVEVAVGENEAFDCWNTGATPEWDNNKQKYMLAVVITVPPANWSDILTAKMYVKIGDTKYYMGKAEYSVNSLAEKYLLTETDAETVFTLNTLAGKAVTEVE